MTTRPSIPLNYVHCRSIPLSYTVIPFELVYKPDPVVLRVVDPVHTVLVSVGNYPIRRIHRLARKI